MPKEKMGHGGGYSKAANNHKIKCSINFPLHLVLLLITKFKCHLVSSSNKSQLLFSLSLSYKGN